MSDQFKVSGRRLPLEAGPGAKLSQRPGGWLILENADGTRERLMVLESGTKLSASIGGRLLHGDLEHASRGGPGGAAGADDLTAQFPGKIRKILVAAGHRAKAGEPLLLVEAMKMEFSIKAPTDGVVAKVLVTEGQQISPGTRFVEFTGG